MRSDNKVKLLYQLENQELPAGPGFPSFVHARAFVNFVVASQFWQEKDSLPRKIVLKSNGDREFSEFVEPNEVWLAYRHLNTQCVLHELAHALPCLGHGMPFVNFYLNLVNHFMGIEYGNIYRCAFRRVGIKY